MFLFLPFLYLHTYKNKNIHKCDYIFCFLLNIICLQQGRPRGEFEGAVNTSNHVGGGIYPPPQSILRE